MRKRKKIIVIILVLAVLLGVGYWYLFRGSRIPDGSSEIMTGEDGTYSQDQTDEADSGQTEPERTADDVRPEESALGYITEGTEEYRGFVIDNVFHSASEGDIHYNVYIPENYDGSEPYALYFTLPGYEGLYFQGVAANLQSEEFGFEAQEYDEKMIIVAPQLSD